MKQIKNGILTAIVVLSGAFSACAQTESYTISGNFNGASSGKVKLIRFSNDGRTSTAIDSAVIKNHTYVLKGKLKSPEMMGLVFEPGNWDCKVFIENSAITLNADTADATHHPAYDMFGINEGANLTKVTISGSKVQDDYLKLKGMTMSQVTEFVEANPSDPAGIYAWHQLYIARPAISIPDMEAFLDKFKGAAAQSVYYALLQKKLAQRKAVLPGSKAPDFTLEKRDGTPFKLSSLAGKYVLIDFWASWCVPCRKGIPHLKEIYAKYRDKGFEIVSVANDKSQADWIKALDQENMPWIQVRDYFPPRTMLQSQVLSLYLINALPSFVLIDREGKIIQSRDFDKTLQEIFGI